MSYKAETKADMANFIIDKATGNVKFLVKPKINNDEEVVEAVVEDDDEIETTDEEVNFVGAIDRIKSMMAAKSN